MQVQLKWSVLVQTITKIIMLLFFFVAYVFFPSNLKEGMLRGEKAQNIMKIKYFSPFKVRC